MMEFDFQKKTELLLSFGIFGWVVVNRKGFAWIGMIHDFGVEKQDIFLF